MSQEAGAAWDGCMSEDSDQQHRGKHSHGVPAQLPNCELLSMAVHPRTWQSMYMGRCGHYRKSGTAGTLPAQPQPRFHRLLLEAAAQATTNIRQAKYISASLKLQALAACNRHSPATRSIARCSDTS